MGWVGRVIDDEINPLWMNDTSAKYMVYLFSEIIINLNFTTGHFISTWFDNLKYFTSNCLIVSLLHRSFRNSVYFFMALVQNIGKRISRLLWIAAGKLRES